MSKCTECNGTGFKEYRGGLLRVDCETCNGTGEDSMSSTKTLAKKVDTALGKAGEFEELVLEARKEIDKDAGLIGRVSAYLEGRIIGIYFRIMGKGTQTNTDKDIDTMWAECKKEAAEKLTFPYVIDMPCGHDVIIQSQEEFENIPIEDRMCPCGKPNHYVWKFDDQREVNADDSKFLTKEAFELSYAAKSHLTIDELHEMGLVAEPCDCGEKGCQGWAMKPKDEVEDDSNSEYPHSLIIPVPIKGKTIDETMDIASAIINSSKVKANDSNTGANGDNRLTGSGNAGGHQQPPKPKTRRRAKNKTK